MNTPFVAYFPRKPEEFDEVVIRGKLTDNAQNASFNFCLRPPAGWPEDQTSPYIAYHLKISFTPEGESKVTQNWKNVEWQQEQVSKNWLVGDRSKPFTAVFRLLDNQVKVFADNVQHSPDYEMDMQLPIEEIHSVELWNDFEYVEELTFRFNNARDSYQLKA
ncbi:uncharacterized protein LOC126581330 isoform X1 [Anopheles aquasalis]|uniref:uncharacterized protein LOC126581330 isoform X1 n=1 Tax=Anopheles aquasalis TaxID=42839 RepID=UPI00215A44F6|nr:uncharacterized protein LOC126581330 isoform X1 [Anopheles aquasalis]